MANAKQPTRIEHSFTMGMIGDRPTFQEMVIGKDAPREVEICRIKGHAAEFETQKKQVTTDGKTTERKNTFIKGRFQILNMVKKEVIITGQLLLPDSVGSYILGSIPCDVDMTVQLARAEKSQTGYKFIGFDNNFSSDFGDDNEETKTNAATSTETKISDGAATSGDTGTGEETGNKKTAARKS